MYFVVGFEVLTAVSMKMAVFWVVAACSLVEFYQRFRGPCCLHHQGDHRPDDGGSKGPLKRWYNSTRLHAATTQKTAIFILIAVKTSNPTTASEMSLKIVISS
jgi:hypothetical protein